MTRLVSMSDLATAARLTLRRHLPAYLAANQTLGEDTGGALVLLPAPLPVPTSYEQVPTREAIAPIQGSTIAVTVAGTKDLPVRHASGAYDADYVLSVAVFHEQTPDMPILSAASDYVACIRACLLQHRSLLGQATHLAWVAESFDLMGDGVGPLTLGLGVCEFTVKASAVVDDSARARPGPPGPLVQTTYPLVTVEVP